MALAYGQRVPSLAENIEYLVTFSKGTSSTWGDDDNTQVYFVSISKASSSPFYIRVFDADIGGMYDAANGGFDSKCRMSVYGGQGVYSKKVARNVDPVKGYKSGLMLTEEVIGASSKYDNKWLTLGPFNPKEGEFDSDLDSYVFKFIVEGTSGNDGNLYYFYLSSMADENREVPGANAFTYEMTFRVPNDGNRIPHLYPFIDSEVISVKINNFDFDNGGGLRVTSVKKNAHEVKKSGDGNWAQSVHQVVDAERKTSYDIHVLDAAKFSNDMTIYVTNQYDESLPFFAKPINGIPKYSYKPGITRKIE